MVSFGFKWVSAMNDRSTSIRIGIVLLYRKDDNNKLRFNDLKKGPLGVWEDMEDDDGKGLVTHKKLLFEVSKQMIQIFGQDVRELDRHDRHPFFKVSPIYDLSSSTRVTAKKSPPLVWKGSNGEIFMELLVKNGLSGEKSSIREIY